MDEEKDQLLDELTEIIQAHIIGVRNALIEYEYKGLDLSVNAEDIAISLRVDISDADADEDLFDNWIFISEEAGEVQLLLEGDCEEEEDEEEESEEEDEEEDEGPHEWTESEGEEWKQP